MNILNLKPFLLDLNPIEFKYYPFMITLNKCNRNYNTFNDISDKKCVSNKIEDVNLSVFDLITRRNE